MGAYLEVRTLDSVCYEAVSGTLNSIAEGNRANLSALLKRARQALTSPSFLKWNSAAADRSFLRDWVETLDEAETQNPSQSVAEEVAQVAVPALCMPEFQWWAGAVELSPTLQAIGDYDGGLYAALANSDRWFEDMAMDGLGGRHAPYPYGQSMLVLEPEAVVRFSRVVESLTEEMCAAAFAPEYCSRAKGRLLSLLRRTTSNRAELVAVCGA